MDIEELPIYIRAVDEAIENFPELTVLKAAECEYADEYHAFFEDKLLGEHQLDYLIGAAHFFQMDGQWVGSYGGADSREGLRGYADYFVKSMESKLFAFMAHPDLFGNCYLNLD